MSRLSTARAKQIGYLDSEAHEIIELINNYPHPFDFLQWLTDGKAEYRILQERLEEGKYTRISQSYLKDTLVFTGRIEYNVCKAPKETVQFLTKARKPIDSTMPEVAKFRKQPAASVSEDLHYTVISSLFVNEESIGFSWDIFELPPIIKLYHKMNDPLRHWRKS